LIPNTADLEAVAGPRVAGQKDAVGRVEAGHDLAAVQPERERHLAVDPDFRVVVDRDLEHDSRPGGIEGADTVGDRDVDAVPVEADAAGREPAHRVCRPEPLPPRLVEVDALRVR